MRLPGWDEFNKKLTELEQRAAGAVEKFKDNHPVLDSTIKGLLPLLPPPFDSVAERIYDSFDGSPKDKSEEVLGYFQKLQSQGKEHYEQIAAQLDNILVQVEDLARVTAKESTVETIQEILVSSGKVTNQKLDLLRDELEHMGQKIDRIEEKTDESNQLLAEIKAKLDQLGVGATLIPGQQISVSNDQLAVIEGLKGELEKSGQRLELSLDYFLKDANAYYYAGQYGRALELYDRILKFHETEVAALYNKGVLFDALGNYQEALVWFNKVLEVDPENFKALYSKGTAFLKLGIYQESLIWFDKALGIDSKYADAFNNEGEALVNLVMYQKALVSFDRALELDPKHVDALNNKGTVFFNLGNYQEALIWFDKALEVNPKYANALYNKGASFFDLHTYQDALIWYEKALEVDPKNVKALNSTGAALINLRRYQEALIWFDKALDVDPKNASALYNKSSALCIVGNEEESLKLLEQAISLDARLKERARVSLAFANLRGDSRFDRVVS
jgi:tetratricopeptide (TPR) repeat protein